jgi:hypothetical protein
MVGSGRNKKYKSLEVRPSKFTQPGHRQPTLRTITTWKRILASRGPFGIELNYAASRNVLILAASGAVDWPIMQPAGTNGLGVPCPDLFSGRWVAYRYCHVVGIANGPGGARRRRVMGWSTLFSLNCAARKGNVGPVLVGMVTKMIYLAVKFSIYSPWDVHLGP